MSFSEIQDLAESEKDPFPLTKGPRVSNTQYLYLSVDTKELYFTVTLSPYIRILNKRT